MTQPCMSVVGTQARLMSQALRKLTANASKCNCTIIFINQLRHKVGVVYGNPEVTSGGQALKFYASVRLEVRRKGTVEDSSGEGVGIKVKAKVSSHAFHLIRALDKNLVHASSMSRCELLELEPCMSSELCFCCQHLQGLLYDF